MRRIASILFLLLMSPIIVGAVSSPRVVPQQQVVVTQDPTLNLTSDMFGLHSPLSLGLQYSETFGAIFQGRFTQSIFKHNAISIGAEYGANQRRIDATAARALTHHQRVKVTAENLAQNIDFNFASGKTGEWVNQPAYGLTYQYLISNKLVQDLNLNAMYSRAISETLRDKNYVNASSTTVTNLRHVAGATDMGASAGVDVRPLPSTLIGLQLNYDNVNYNARYSDNDAKNASGLGATVSLNQLLSKRVKLQLLASNRKPYDDYKVGVSWLVPSAAGSQLEVVLSGDRLIAQTGTNNDTQASLNLNYSLDGDTKTAPALYNLSTQDAPGDLSDWTGQPAVHMDQVLAVRDEATVAAPVSLIPPLLTTKKKAPGVSDAPYVNPNFPQPVPTQKAKQGEAFRYSTQALNYDDLTSSKGMFFDPNSALNSTTFNTNAINNGILKNSGLTAVYDKGANTFSITGTPATDNMEYNVAVKASNFAGESADAIVIPIEIGTPTPPTITVHPIDHFTVNAALPATDIADITAGSGTISSVTINDHATWSAHGLTATVVSVNATTDKIMLSGTPTDATFSEETLKLDATNTAGLPVSNNFYLNIAGAPVWKQDATISTPFEAGTTITPVGLTALDLFSNPTKSGNLSYEVALQPTGFHLTVDGTELKGSLDNTIATGDYAIDISGTNTIGTSVKAATIHVSVTAATDPTITINPIDHVTVGTALPATDIADITAGSGTISSVTIDDNATWSAHGLTATVVSVDVTTDKIMLSGTPTDATFAEETLTIAATNSTSKTNSQPFQLNVAGRPLWKQNATITNAWVPGENISAIDLSALDLFQNPLKSGDLSYSIKSQPNGFHLSISGAQLTGNLDANVAAGTYHVEILGNNNDGTSVDPAHQTTEKAATLTVTASATVAPTITVHPIDHLTVNTALPATDIADIIAGSGDVSNITIAGKATWVEHGLTATVDQVSPKTAKVMLTGTPTEATLSEETLAIAATNTADKSNSQNFALDIAGAPVWYQDAKISTPFQAGTTIDPKKPVDLPALFSNPTKSGNLSYEVTSQPTGFHLTFDGIKLEGSFDKTIKTGDYAIDISGTNTIGTSVKVAVLTVTVNAVSVTQHIQCPTVEEINANIPDGGGPVTVRVTDQKENHYDFSAPFVGKKTRFDHLQSARYDFPAAKNLYCNYILTSGAQLPLTATSVPVSGATHAGFDHPTSSTSNFCSATDSDLWCGYHYDYDKS